MDRRSFLQASGMYVAATAMNAAPAATPGHEPVQSDAYDLAQRLRVGEQTPLEAMDAAIARIQALPKLNAVVLRDFDASRAQAQQMSQLGRAAREQAQTQAPLWGVPFLIKDLNQYVKGTVTTNGCRFYKDVVATYDSTLVQRYKAAGLVLMGKTASPEFGQTASTESTLYGATPNPWNPSFSAGGSSGGAAAAVAAGLMPVAHASDGGGSIRIPASMCGVFGLKPSRGRLPTGPVNMEGWMGLSMNHVVSRSVRDSAHFLDLTAGPEAGSRVRPPKDVSTTYLQALTLPERGLRIAVWRTNYFGLPVHADCVAAQDKAIAACLALGHHVDEVALPALPIQEVFSSLGIMTSVGMAYTLSQREQALGRAVREDELEPLNWRSLQASKQLSAAQLYAARAHFDHAGRVMDLLMQQYDVLLTPVMSAPAPLLGDLSLAQPYESFMPQAMKYAPYTSLFNITGQPAMSVPMHWTADNVPVGVHFVAAYGEEGRLLRLAAQLEQAVPWAQRMPDVSIFKA